MSAACAANDAKAVTPTKIVAISQRMRRRGKRRAIVYFLTDPGEAPPKQWNGKRKLSNYA
jgi:hypothetical protein